MIQHIDVSLVRQDGGTQARAAMAQDAVDEYALAMAEGKSFPAIVTFFDGETYWLGDGFHRVAAHIKAYGISPIQADVNEGTKRDALLYAAGANSDHGVRRTNADKRRAASVLIEDPEWGKWSDREIARRCGVSNDFVSRLRREWVSLNDTAKSKDHKSEHGKVTPSSPSSVEDPSPEPERQAALEAPPVQRLKPAPSPKAGELEAEVLALRKENAELKEHVKELLRFNDEAKEELESLHRILDAEDLRAAFDKEVKRNQELARVIQSRNNGLMVENHDLSKLLKAAQRTIKRLKGQDDPGPAQNDPEQEDYNATFQEIPA